MNNLEKAIIEFAKDHYKYFKCYPLEFEYQNKIYDHKFILEIIKKYN